MPINILYKAMKYSSEADSACVSSECNGHIYQKV